MIGATGGSGTRVLARVLRRAGMYTGTYLYPWEDAIEFGDYSDRWINRFAPYRRGGAPEALEEAMLDDLCQVLARHLRDVGPEPRPWGWKEPRSIFLLPFLDRHLPSLRFVHLVRDGRDMAFSANQNQLRWHGGAVGLPLPGLSPPAQSMALWSWLNSETARFGRDRLGQRYLRIRYEDLCRDPVAVATRVFAFYRLDGDPELAREEIAPPSSLRRWRDAPAILAELDRIGGPTLAELGYARSG